MLEVRDIVKSYENKPLLGGISFTVAEDETVCLLGASGSGKSTLLRMIAGLEFPERGHILFNGIDLSQTPPHLRDFGLVFQDYGLFPHLDIFDNIAFGLKMRNIPSHQIELRVAALLEQVNLDGFEKRKVTELSGGEQQRVALARALAPNPRLLMFDEPLGALDKTLKDDLLNELRGILHQTRIPAIYVTHDQDEAFAIADRILLLHDGKIIRDGRPDDVWENPNSEWAARMLGMGNVIEGEVVSANKVKTEYGSFVLNCVHQHKPGDRVPLLLKQSDDGAEEIKLKVEDVLFKRDQFEVKARNAALSGEAASKSGLIVHMQDAPKVGQIIKVRVKVQCLA